MQGFLVRLSNSAPRKRNRTDTSVVLSSSQPPPKRLQAYLDVGQKSLGKATHCSQCSMVFINDDPEDRANHNRYCQQAKRRAALVSVSGHNIVVQRAGGAQTVIRVTRAQSHGKTAIADALSEALTDIGGSYDLVAADDPIFLMVEKGGVIAGCLVCDKNVAPQRCVYVTQFTELSGPCVKWENNPPQARGTTCVVEKVEKKNGKQSIRGENGNNNVTNDVEGYDDDDTNAADAVQIVTAAGADEVVPFAPTDGKLSATQPAQLGVKLIWVAPEYRRRGVARDLLDAARMDLIFGSVVALDAIAFSQPTEEGFAFAQGYCGNERVRVYS